MSIVQLANEYSTQLLKKNLYHLASDEMEGRLMASHGDRLASLFVAEEFKKTGLTAPYNKTYFQTVKAEKKIIAGSLQINNKIHVYTDAWKLYSLSPINLKNV